VVQEAASGPSGAAGPWRAIAVDLAIIVSLIVVVDTLVYSGVKSPQACLLIGMLAGVLGVLGAGAFMPRSTPARHIAILALLNGVLAVVGLVIYRKALLHALAPQLAPCSTCWSFDFHPPIGVVAGFWTAIGAAITGVSLALLLVGRELGSGVRAARARRGSPLPSE